jgi:hypothetical protein
VLVEYSQRMKTLLKNPDKFYSPRKRPSGHDIGSGFGKSGKGLFHQICFKFLIQIQMECI